ncbi:MAG: hypothetical protein ACI4FZ_08935 [Lachnospiraceae bacterium]
MTIDYQIQLIQFPTKKIRESVIENEDGSYTIFIESSLTKEKQQEAFEHAMTHIIGDDFTKDDVNKIEFEAHATSEHNQELRACLQEYDKKVGLIGIIQSYKHGCTSLHEMSEFLEVTEEFLSEALERYRGKYGCYTVLDNYIIYFEPSLAVIELYSQKRNFPYIF